MNTRTAVGLSVLSATLASGCGSGSGSNDGMPKGPDACLRFTSTLAIKDRMDQQVNVFNSGEEIRFELDVTNNGNVPETLYAGSPCSAAVSEVTDSIHQKVWGSEDGIFCAAVVQPRTFAPFETVSYVATWLQQRSGAVFPAPPVLVPPGQYTVKDISGQ